MTTALTAEPAVRQHPPAVAADCTPPLAGVRLGSGEYLLVLVRAALEIDDTRVQAVAGQPAGFVLVVEGWSGELPPTPVADALGDLGDLDGRPVGLVVAAADISDAVASLAFLRARIAVAGGLPLDGGICVEPIDAACDARGELTDITLHSRLVLLGRRVQRLAANRLTLRATA